MLVVISNKTHFWLAEESTKWKYFNIVSGIDTTQCSTYCPVTTLKTEVGLLSQANLKSHWFRLPSVPSRSTRTWRSWKLFLKESIASSKKKTHFTSCPWAEQRCCGKGVTSPDTESFRSQVEISTLKIRPHFSLNSFKFFEVAKIVRACYCLESTFGIAFAMLHLFSSTYFGFIPVFLFSLKLYWVHLIVHPSSSNQPGWLWRPLGTIVPMHETEKAAGNDSTHAWNRQGRWER